MGISSSKNNSESLNWDKINTESMSTTVPNINNISKEAIDLISNLDINNNVDFEKTESDNDNLFTWIKTIGDDKDRIDKIEDSATFSDTSAFISSDMYKYLMNKNTESVTSNNQMGGGIQEDSSTSSTSSSSAKKTKDKSDKNDKNKKNDKNDKNTKNTKNKMNNQTVTSSTMSGGDISYLSSSAHTAHSHSDVIVTSNYESSSDSNEGTYVSNDNTSVSNDNTSVSVGNNKMLTSSINTSDINLVSPNE